MAIESLSPKKEITLTLVDRTSASVPTPASGTVTIFSEGGILKQKDSAGVVTLVTNDVGGGLSHGQVLRRLELLDR